MPEIQTVTGATTPEKLGESIPGFLGVQAEDEYLKFWFINSETGKKADMGGASTFYVDEEGLMVKTE